MERRITRSQVLGKRTHESTSSASSSTTCDTDIPTPEPTPKLKRARTLTFILEVGDCNKENIKPFGDGCLDTPSRALSRASSEIVGSTSSSRGSSTTNRTPATAIAQLTISTPPPTPPTLLLPIHAKARACLRSTCNDATDIAGRSEERSNILAFVAPFLEGTEQRVDDEAEVSTTLYISGTPGTGKTALVNSVIASLNTEDASVKVLAINCMALNNVEALWERLIEELTVKGKTVSRGKKVKGKAAAEKALKGSKSKCILILDELDHIAASFTSLVALFSLPQSASSNLRVIGIANTHTLTSSLSQFSMHGVTGVTTLHFAPYTPTQLLEILQTRLAPLYAVENSNESAPPATTTNAAKKFMPSPTLVLLTKKIAAQTGDVRSLFEVLRGAIDLAVAANTKLVESAPNPLDTPSPVVTPAHILVALKAYAPASTSVRPGVAMSTGANNNSEVVAKIRNLGIQARLVLLSILIASKRFEGGVGLSASPPIIKAKPTTKRTTPSTPSRRIGSTIFGTPSTHTANSGIDTTQLHAFYSSMLTRGASGVFAPVSRSEFADLVGILETVGIAALSSSFTAPMTPTKSPSKSGARFGSFGGASKNQGQEVRLVEGVRGDEVCRGLGILDETPAEASVAEEEVCAIWARESGRLGRDVKALERATAKSTSGGICELEGATES